MALQETDKLAGSASCQGKQTKQTKQPRQVI
jgi:hypothetical protein